MSIRKHINRIKILNILHLRIYIVVRVAPFMHNKLSYFVSAVMSSRMFIIVMKDIFKIILAYMSS